MNMINKNGLVGKFTIFLPKNVLNPRPPPCKGSALFRFAQTFAYVKFR
jgi:hypothetical protein